MKKVLSVLAFMAVSFIVQAQTPKIIAHRGAWKNTNTPQNSIAALKEAIKQKVWGSEFDVVMTKDSVLLVNHDHDFKGIDIATNNYETFKNLTLANGEKIPTAREYLTEGFKQKKTKMVYEIKPSKLGQEHSKLAARLAYELVKEMKGLKNTVFISFSYDACLQLLELDPNVNVQFLDGNKSPIDLKKDKIKGLDYHYNVYKNNPNYIAEAKKSKLKTNVWTVNTEVELQYFIDQKVDYITTDEPELLFKLLKK